jgi:outer membrane lipoprotein carrier protein
VGLWTMTLLTTFLASAAPAPSGPAAMNPDVKALVDRMQAFYEKVQDFTADFSQSYTYKMAKRIQTSTGKVTFKKPGMMRWEYEKPTPKTFVLAGDRAYTYDPQAMLLTKAAFDQSQLSASVTFLFGTGKLEKEFTISRVDCPKCTGTLLELLPLKPDPRFKKVRLEVDPKTAQVLRSIVYDPDGSENAITFSNLKTNVGVNKDVFVLNAPEGTQIQDLTAPAPKK